MKKVILIPILAALVSCSQSAVTLPQVFSDHMVLQRDRPVPVWGKTDSRARVTLEWQGEKVTVKADASGAWKAELPATPAGGPFTLKVNDVVLQDILVGDVFLCSGQSNMELPVDRCLDAVADEVKDYTNTQVRYLLVPMAYDFDGPREDIPETSWQVLDSPEKGLGWGAVSYFTAKYLQEDTGVPVGMINASVGGSPIEAWLREGALPDYAMSELEFLRRPGVLDSLNNFNAHLYVDWQNAHNALPANTAARWKGIDIFSHGWGKDAKGENLYGSHFLRRSFRLPKGWDGPAVLHLGAMIDADSTFVNGQYVGNTTYMYPPRNYNVPEGVLKEGENTVEIHLYACGGNPPGFVPDKEYSLETPQGKVSLLKGWEHKPGRRMPARAPQVFLHYKAAGLYNGMEAPLKDFAFAGFIWYQGESNTWNAADYGNLLETLVRTRREELATPDLPFYIIELAAFEHSELTDTDWGWNRVQKEQRRTAERVEGVYLVPNADLGEWNDIHPQDKATVGRRTADVILSSRADK
ncbi:MAG: sialate O-acetylesterase [Bacteroidales bacterium]|nr:sialate O-acetylesterase [Bacteroidales bacterium]